MSRVMCHMSYVTCHISCVTCHMSKKFSSSFSSDKVVKLIDGRSVINGAYPIQFSSQKANFFCQMACIYLLNSRRSPRSFDFDITYFYPIIVTPSGILDIFNNNQKKLQNRFQLKPDQETWLCRTQWESPYIVVQQTTTVSLTGFPVLRTLYKPMYMHKRTKSQNCEFCVL